MKMVIIGIISLGVTSCCGLTVAPSNVGDNINVDSIDIDPPGYYMDGLLFKEGRPSEGGDLDSAMSDSIAGRKALMSAVDFLKGNRSVRIEVRGYADSKECEPEACIELTKRRAILVRDWLSARGVSPIQLLMPKWFGSSNPIDFSHSEKQRNNNRRVELKVMSDE